MSDKRKGKQLVNDEDQQKATKEEYAVAKYLRFGLPVREGKLHGMEVKCFIANAAIDKLLESKWSASKTKTDPIFTSRKSCVDYMNILLEKGLFHRADRDKRKKDKESTKKKKKEKDTEKEEPSGEEELRQRKGKKEKKSKKEKEQTSTEKGKDDTDVKDEKKKEDKKKKERRLKLLMSEDQWFEDGDEVYVWIYDPVNVKTFLIGLLMVLGAIGLCMFPLWPEEVRIGVYYLSLAAAGFVGFILFLTVVRLILFCIVWALTFGKHHFWFLPNLTEDVGFFDSFRPLYKHDVMSKEEDSNSQNGKKKKKKKSDSEQDEKESKKVIEKSSDKDDSDEFEVIKEEDLDESKEELDKNTENSGEDDEEENEENENDLNEDESEDYNEEEDAQNNSGSEMEDKKLK